MAPLKIGHAFFWYRCIASLPMTDPWDWYGIFNLRWSHTNPPFMIGKYNRLVVSNIFLMFTPKIGEDEPNLTFAYLSDGLVKNHQPDTHPMGIRHGRVEVPQFPKRPAPRTAMGRKEGWNFGTSLLKNSWWSQGELRRWKIQGSECSAFFVVFSLYYGGFLLI